MTRSAPKKLLWPQVLQVQIKKLLTWLLHIFCHIFFTAIHSLPFHYLRSTDSTERFRRSLVHWDGRPLPKLPKLHQVSHTRAASPAERRYQHAKQQWKNFAVTSQVFWLLSFQCSDDNWNKSYRVSKQVLDRVLSSYFPTLGKELWNYWPC